MSKTTVTLIPGDGIGPEVSRATSVLKAAGAELEWEALAAPLGGGLQQPLPPEVLSRSSNGVAGGWSRPRSAAEGSIQLRQRSTSRQTSAPRSLEASWPLPGSTSSCAGEHRGPLRRLGAHRRPWRGREHQGHHREGLAAHRPLRLRVRPAARPQAGHGRAQGQHHEALGRPLPRLLPPRGRGVPRDRSRRQDRRQHVHAAGNPPRGVGRPVAREPLRRHRVRSLRRPGGRPRRGARRQHGTMPRSSRPCTARPPSRQGPRQPSGPDPLVHPHALLQQDEAAQRIRQRPASRIVERQIRTRDSAARR